LNREDQDAPGGNDRTCLIPQNRSVCSCPRVPAPRPARPSRFWVCRGITSRSAIPHPGAFRGSRVSSENFTVARDCGMTPPATWPSWIRTAPAPEPSSFGTARSTLRLLSITRGKIWFTETGGLVTRRVYEGRRVVHTYRYSLRHAARSTAHVLALSCLSRRIARVYLYHWQPPRKVTNWDSGLVDWRGRARPAYRALRRWLSHSASAARRGGRRALCG